MEEYLTITELSARLKLKPKTIRNKMATGVFDKGVHYFSPTGLSPRFKWSAVVQWIEKKHEVSTADEIESIPMAKGYKLGATPKP
jgi:hypothetical protein